VFAWCCLSYGKPASVVQGDSSTAQLWTKQHLFAPELTAGHKDALLQQEVGCAEATVQLLQEAAMTGAWGAALGQPGLCRQHAAG